MANKIIIGVHGIGDQIRYETIQAISYQFCRHYKIPAAVPLGSFHNIQNDGIVLLPSADGTLYLTEAYWADIARRPEVEGYTLEETKQWAKTIVERFRARVNQYKSRSAYSKNRVQSNKTNILNNDELYLDRGSGKHDRVRLDYRMIRSVLYEAIDTVDVLEKLLFIAGKAGIFQFNLKWILTNFLGDVQIVTEFEKCRSIIVNRFTEAASSAYELDKKAAIYVIAHSEGTVVSFLGLLEGIKQKQPWVNNVKGFMTLGSPIDKHLTLWPHLWDGYVQLPGDGLKGQIQWRNYYDRGDPVGYELDTARAWVNDNCMAFDFREGHDYGFSRYLLPGKAHVDYWKDDEVFDNFINSVVEPEKTAANETAPKNKFIYSVICNVFPYVAISALLMFAVYFLYKPIYNILVPEAGQTISPLLRYVGGFASLLAGITILARVPRLTHHAKPVFISLLFFIFFAWASFALLRGNGNNIIDSSLFGSSYVAVALAISLLASAWSALSSSARSRPLVILGGTAVIWLAIHVALTAGQHPPIWPVLLGGAVFIYGWWLSILLFDLVFVWHWYIRNSKALKRLREIQT